MDDSYFEIKFLKIKLSTIISSDNLDFSIKLDFHLCCEILAVLVDIWFIFKQVNPNAFTKIIYYDKKKNEKPSYETSL